MLAVTETEAVVFVKLIVPVHQLKIKFLSYYNIYRLPIFFKQTRSQGSIQAFINAYLLFHTEFLKTILRNHRDGCTKVHKEEEL